MRPQVEKRHYTFGQYTKPPRWMSHYYQICSVLESAPANVLEIGAGNGVLRSYLRGTTSVVYTSVDVAEDLRPDIVASITKLPLPDKTYDVVCAFQVLEHIPFEQVPTAVGELCRVAKSRVVISVPHSGPSFSLLLRLPVLPKLRVAWKPPFPVAHRFDGQHYWELGKRGYSLNKFRMLLKKYAKIEEEFLPFENPYHRFFILSPTR